MLSFLAYGTFHSDVAGLDAYPEDQCGNIELLYYSFHIMAGLGLFIAIMGLATLLRLRGKLETTQPLLWLLMLAFPFTYITTIWLDVRELGRPQP